MHSVNGELSTFTDIPLWIKEQVSRKQPPWSFLSDVREDGSDGDSGAPSQGSGLHCPDAKKHVVLLMDQSGVCKGTVFLEKKVTPCFPMGRHIENRPRQSLLQADWKKGVPLIHSFGAWERVPEWSPGRKGPG